MTPNADQVYWKEVSPGLSILEHGILQKPNLDFQRILSDTIPAISTTPTTAKDSDKANKQG